MVSSSSSVTFCVGGSFFTTLNETLAKEPSCRLSMMARGTLPCTKDIQGVILIDRDPKHFQSLLNFIRDGWALLPSTADERTELLHELRFFQLTSMESWMRSQDLVNNRPPPPSPSLATRFSSHMTLATNPQNSPTLPHSQYSPGFTSWGGQPTVAYTGLSPSRRALFSTSNAQQDLADVTRSNIGGVMNTPQAKVIGGGGGGGDFRAAFTQATMASPAPAPAPSYSLPTAPPALISTSGPALAPTDSSVGKWTAKYLQSHEALREVANTLMELAYLPPHRSLHAGKVEVKVSSECRHDRPASLLTQSAGIHASASLPFVSHLLPTHNPLQCASLRNCRFYPSCCMSRDRQ